jgi:adenine-specific DNA-methyltransferase
MALQTNILSKLTGLIESYPNYLVEGVINKNLLAADARKYDASLLNLLLKDADIKKHFFTDTEDGLIFKKDIFLQFISNKEFLPDSYTKYKIKIGLGAEDGSLLSENGEVVLNWPYKDAVLEGNQDKVDQKRSEVFFNEVLAPDQITRLLDDKVFTNWKRYDKDGEHDLDILNRDDNLVIKGNNLVVLHSLKKRYAGKVKLIYIDPPYNTGSDSFGYNDRFNHSTWLTFMKNRLTVAKELLQDDGVIFVQCDDNEQAYLKVLMDEIFKGNFLNTISVKTKVSAGASGGGEDRRLKKNIEYIHCYYKKTFSAFNDVYKETEIVSYIEQMKKDGKSFKYTQVLVSEGKKEHFETIKDGSGEDITIYKHSGVDVKTISQLMKDENLSIKQAYDKYFDKIFTTTNAQSSIRQRVWKATGENKDFFSIEYVPKSGRSKGKLTTQFYTGNKKVLLIWFSDTATRDKKGNVVKKEKYGTFWDRIDYNNLNKEGDTVFPSGKKPEQLVRRVIDMATSKGDLVLDYHLGSGTTAAIAHKMGRRYIGIEQLYYGDSDPTVRLQNVINGDQSGISKITEWQGGGSFVYANILNNANKFRVRVEQSKSDNDYINLLKEATSSSFLSYRVDPKKLSEDEFRRLSAAEKRRLLLELIDNNTLYVNYADINDPIFKVTDRDKEFNKKLYEEK